MAIVLLAGIWGCGAPPTPEVVPPPAPPAVPVAVVTAPAPTEPAGPVALKATIESISTSDLVVDGHEVVIDGNTVFDGFGDRAPAVGDLVEVHGTRSADGTVVATRITGGGAKAAPPRPRPGSEED